jgi:adenylate cyclase
MLNPNSAYAWMMSGWVSAFQNRSGRAIEALQRAIRLSPLDPLGWLFTTGLAFAYCIAEQYEEATEAADRALRERPHNTAAIRTKVASCSHLGRIEEAREWLQRLLELQPGYTIADFTAQQPLPQEIRAVYTQGFRKAGLPEE